MHVIRNVSSNHLWQYNVRSTYQLAEVCIYGERLNGCVVSAKYLNYGSHDLVLQRTMFGSAVPKPSKMLVTRWSTDPYSLGAYSYTGIGVVAEDFDGLAVPVAGRIFFAGEHTLFDYHATVHGAYLSGTAAADKVVALCCNLE